MKLSEQNENLKLTKKLLKSCSIPVFLGKRVITDVQSDTFLESSRSVKKFPPNSLLKQTIIIRIYLR